MQKLLLDEMLKRTMKWLRIFGIDTEHAEGRDDTQLLAIAEKENRVLVTKDAELLERCEKRKLKCHFLKSGKLEDQLAELQDTLGLVFPFPQKTRCPACNADLVIVSGSDVLSFGIPSLVESSVLERHNKFWLCKKCNKAYWEGSHWRNIMRIFENVKKISLV
jgi:hypothetical protein